MDGTMSTDNETLREIARQSLLPDFFAARVDEEGLWSPLQQTLSRIQQSPPNAIIEKVKVIASQAASASDFIEKIKSAKLWLELKELVARVRVK